MSRPQKLAQETVDAWLAAQTAWSSEGAGITRTYKFKDFSTALGFVVRVGLVAEKRDHHPDIELGWGKAKVFWSTHDAGGITQLDLDLAAAVDEIFGADG